MQLPFRVVLHRPHRAAISRWVRKWRWWIATVCVILNTTAAFVNHQLVQRAEEAHGGVLVISSSPAGAVVEVDDRTRGETPATISLSAKPHRVTLRRDGYAPVARDVSVTTAQTVTLQADLWLASPRVERLRPTFPGAEITNAFFLADGRVALALALQPGDERQLWVLDNGGGARRLGPPNVHGSLAVSPDGRAVAYLARGQGGSAIGNRLDVVWLIASEGQRGVRAYTLPENVPDESLVDLAWTPDGRGLLLASRQSLMGLGGRTLLRRLDTATLETRDLVSLPSEVVAGSYLWSPDSIHVAFLSRAEQTTSLCILNIQSGEFRYLADVSWDSAAPLPFPPVAWSTDGQRLLYSAPAQDRSTQANWFFATRPAMAVFETALTTRSGQRLGDAEGQSPILRPDGVILALTRVGGSKPLVLRQVMPTGETQDVGTVPLKAPSTFAVRWDAAHAQAIVAIDASGSLGSSQAEYWLVTWRPREAQ